MEILFRGKPIKDIIAIEVADNSFIYGFFKQVREKCFIERFVEPEDNRSWGWRSYQVIPETVGQYIGVKGYKGNYNEKHLNEVKLFDGDIVEAYSQGQKGTFVIKFRNESAPMWLLYPNFQHGEFWNIAASDSNRAKGDYFDNLKRIGNIHDNPELLKEREG